MCVPSALTVKSPTIDETMIRILRSVALHSSREIRGDHRTRAKKKTAAVRCAKIFMEMRAACALLLLLFTLVSALSRFHHHPAAVCRSP
jgi:hypothetical protein